MRIAQSMVDQIVSHARQALPNECCGILIGTPERVTLLTSTTNAFASPTRFEIDSNELIRAWNQAQERGEDIAGFYHSHVEAPAHPSQTDINWAKQWPGVVHVICSLGDAEPVVKGFLIEDGRVDEVALNVE